MRSGIPQYQGRHECHHEKSKSLCGVMNSTSLALHYVRRILLLCDKPIMSYVLMLITISRSGIALLFGADLLTVTYVTHVKSLVSPTPSMLLENVLPWS